MAISFASAAATSNLGDGQSIGKPIEGMTTPGSVRNGGGDINWVDFNYPPFLRIIHYNLEELPSSLSGLVFRLNISFQLTVFTCFLNLVDTLVIVFSTNAPKRWFLLSLIHLVLFPAAALAVFYAGYRGLAEPDAQLLQKYKMSQPVLGFVYFLLMLVPWGSTNGLAKLGHIRDHASEGSVFWTVVIFAESFFWLVNVLFAVLNLYRAHHFDQMGASGPGVAMAASRF
eukprot:TRINITY_DN102975_c0_g1_i1.p1 TRINITY_DN102975_c0_g1~~TRINITY_DN102975_c0_g1_i1.p1  ORF type:complete len:228 (-),score=43.05 TRINITY_DN102975_c0_g1_i1:111-794(-)